MRRFWRRKRKALQPGCEHLIRIDRETGAQLGPCVYCGGWGP